MILKQCYILFLSKVLSIRPGAFHLLNQFYTVSTVHISYKLKKSKNQQLHVNLAFWCLHDTIVKVMKNKEYKFSALPVIITLMEECTV